MKDIQYFDIHSHLNFSQFDADREETIEQMRQEGIATICVGTDIDTSKESIELALKHEHIWATAGLHPTDWEKGFDIGDYEDLFGDKVVGVGETGFDYFRSQEGKNQQKQIFEAHVELANKKKLPLMLHGRPRAGSMDAYEDMLDILESFPTFGGHIHFFVGDVGVARRFLGLGFTIGFDGPITFARDYDEVIRFVPLDMLCAETDAPFAAPVPYRGQRNSPLHISHIVNSLAKIRDEDPEKLRQATVTNAKRTFNI